MNNILLFNQKEAVYKSSRVTKVPDLDRAKETLIHFYDVPCPICEETNTAHSTDGIFFINMQLCCKHCGIFFKPIVDRQWAIQEFSSRSC
jgi:hypothetical protein